MTIHSISADTSTTILANAAGDMWIVKVNVEVTTDLYAIDGRGTNGSKTFAIHGHLFSDNGSAFALGQTGSASGGSNTVEILSGASITADLSGITSYGGYLTLSNAGTIFGGNSALVAAEGNNSILNTGTLRSVNSTTLYLSGTDNVVTNTGQIQSGWVGVELSGSNTRLLNAGLISTDSSGIRITGDDHGITNTGQIIAGASAIFIDGGGNTVENRGILTSTSSGVGAGVYVISGTGETTRITNSGEIHAADLAITCGSGIDVITNRGLIDGHVALGSGNDVFDGRSGQVLGEIRGGLGDDIYRIWDASLVLIELTDGGVDTVEVEGSLRLAANFENLTLLGLSGWAGTGNGLDNVITGNAQNNRLLGGGGGDSLKGGAGLDVLIGGAGRDYLWGGEDADQFIFRTVGESAAAAPDRIRDFVSGEDVIDLRAIDAVAGGDTNNTFDFIGTAAFSGMAGELRIVNGDTSRAEADVNGDGNADFMLMFTNGVRLHAWDFVL